MTSAERLEALDERGGVPAPAAHLLHVLVELVDQRRDRQGSADFFAGCEADGQILAHVDRIAHIPGVIVQGRYDMICPPSSAYELAQAWPNAELKMVRNAGHALSEPGISAELVRTMDRIAAQ